MVLRNAKMQAGVELPMRILPELVAEDAEASCGASEAGGSSPTGVGKPVRGRFPNSSSLSLTGIDRLRILMAGIVGVIRQ